MTSRIEQIVRPDTDQPSAIDFAWPEFGLISDVRPALASARLAGRTVALATLIDAAGPSPRPIGAQMVVDPDAGSVAGYVSGGCIDAAVAELAMRTLATGEPQRLVFGSGSPYFDIRLTCGSRIEIWVERLRPDNAAVGALLKGWRARQSVLWKLDIGSGAQHCRELDADDLLQPPTGIHPADRVFQMVCAPTPKLIVTGGDPVALALVALGLHAGWEIVLHRTRGPITPPKPWRAVRYSTADTDAFFAGEYVDNWTAIVSTSHDSDIDHSVLFHALRSTAFYVGVIGSRTKLADRHSRLAASGFTVAEMARLHAPVGLQIGSKTPFEIAVSIWADMIRSFRHG